MSCRLVVPSGFLLSSVADTVSPLIGKMQSHSLQIPPPQEQVASWPVVGPKLYALWQQAASDLPGLLGSVGPELASFAKTVMGFAASMGAFLLAAGANGKRYSLPNSKIMIHQVLGGAHGQATDIEIHARDILRTKEQMNRILAERTGQPLEKVQNDTERDYYMSADEAATYGLIDKVIDKRA